MMFSITILRFRHKSSPLIGVLIQYDIMLCFILFISSKVITLFFPIGLFINIEWNFSWEVEWKHQCSKSPTAPFFNPSQVPGPMTLPLN